MSKNNPSQPDLVSLRIIALILAVCLLALVIIFSSSKTTENILEFFGLSDNYVPTTTKKSTESNLEKVKVIRVIDGDTIEIQDGRRIRYLNVDTPETKKPGSPIECFGPEATAFNKALVEDKEVWLLADKESYDRYDRELRFIFLQEEQVYNIEQSVNAKIVELGFGKTLVIKPNDTYAQAFYELQSQAQAQNLGLWSACPN